MTEFDFARTWETPAPVDQVSAVLLALDRYPQWWPQVVAVARIDDDTARVLCRSWLPYTLDLTLTAQRREQHLLRVEIDGDLRGWAQFALMEIPARMLHPTATQVAYEQHVVVAHRGLAVAAQLLRPVMRWNHDHMMIGCERGLRSAL